MARQAEAERKEKQIQREKVAGYALPLEPSERDESLRSTMNSKLKTIEMEFDESYPSRQTFIQRLAVEPRVPMIEGMQFISDKDPETHHMLLSLLFRLLSLPNKTHRNFFR